MYSAGNPLSLNRRIVYVLVTIHGTSVQRAQVRMRTTQSHSPPGDSARHEARVGTISGACENCGLLPRGGRGPRGAGLVGATIACVRWRMCGAEAGSGRVSQRRRPASLPTLCQPHRGLLGELRGGRGETVYVNARGMMAPMGTESDQGRSIRPWWAPCIRDGDVVGTTSWTGGDGVERNVCWSRDGRRMLILEHGPVDML